METLTDAPASRLEELFMEELRELYGAELHQLMVLPLLKTAASSQKLKNVLSSHLRDTREQIERLESIFSRAGVPPLSRTSEAILGITREAEKVIGATLPGSATRDAGLVAAAQKLEHYEISCYGSVAQHARTLDYYDIDEILEDSLMEEKEADDLLTTLAEYYINREAKQEKRS
ncbi:MAG TPA: DUF892 family protein [Puia sp.]|nr:DUF892 family protein [Puia sp.]